MTSSQATTEQISQFQSSLDKHFDPKSREREIYEQWEARGIFRPESAKDQSREVFNICMPPPNANGELHLGHAFGYTVMDILGRYHRLSGKRVLLLPGKDHAGIQTQVVFEKKLKAEKVDLSQLDRSELFKQCYDFCVDRANYMRSQEKRLGISADWSREIFTLDPRVSDVVYDTFEQMWRDGLVYKGKRIVNWSVFSQTAISDVEVEYKDQEGGIWYILYPWADGSALASSGTFKLPSGGELPIGERGLVTATTRPETMLGDTALAVHPEDPRYRNFIGRSVQVPLTRRTIKVIGDKRIDPTFGSGVVKVTPAHDFTDYDIGTDHALEVIQVIGKDGKMSETAGEDFASLTTAECRDKVVEQLGERGLLLDQAKIAHKVPIGERGKDIIEPLISDQWFVAVDKAGKSLKQRALEFVRAGRIKIYPERFQVLFEQWLENLRDWNISRQIWWGHRLPVWYRPSSEVGGAEEVFVGKGTPKGEGWVQERDTFDTWFSSGQWAFSTLSAHGHVNLYQQGERGAFFPSHTMVMGRDILFFWACRMLLLTAYRLNDVPWRNIYFTGLVRDQHGQKMSKSKGNGIEPNAVIDKYGADAVRLALVMGATPGNDLSFAEKKIEGYSKFVNKVWNAAKLVEMKVGSARPSELPRTLELHSSRWIISELVRVQDSVTRHFENDEVSIAADELYGFVWQVYCDWYLEMMKTLVDQNRQTEEVFAVAIVTLRSILKMLHPFIPFVTEEIAQKLHLVPAGAVLAESEWPHLKAPEGADGVVPLIVEIVSAVRSVKAALALSHKTIRIALDCELDAEGRELIASLARVEFCSAVEIDSKNGLRKPYPRGVVVCEVEGKERYEARVEKELAQQRATAQMVEQKLSTDFVNLAKPEVVEKERERLASAQRACTELERELTVMRQ